MTPDGWIRWYYRTRDSFGAPALDYVDSTGRLYGKKCLECGFMTRHCTNKRNWVCGRCGAHWPYVDQHIFKGEVQKSKRQITFDDANARFFDISMLLHDFLGGRFLWDARLYVAHALGHSVRGLSTDFLEAFPDAPGTFSKSNIHRRIELARTEWSRRLAIAKINVSTD